MNCVFMDRTIGTPSQESVSAQEVFREKSLIQGYDAVIDCARRLVSCLSAF